METCLNKNYYQCIIRCEFDKHIALNSWNVGYFNLSENKFQFQSLVSFGSEKYPTCSVKHLNVGFNYA